MVVRIDPQGGVTIPKEMLAGPDVETELDVMRREDGVIELHPRETRDPSQAWFWTERWQRMEREADEDYAAGRYRVYDDAESFLADLEKPAEE